MKHAIQIALLGLALAAPAFAQKSGADHSSHQSGAASEGAALTDGEIRKVDKEAKKITIKHGPIQNLDMPAMTMAFQVKDATMLEKVKIGQKVKFRVENLAGAYTVTRIEVAR